MYGTAMGVVLVVTKEKFQFYAEKVQNVLSNLQETIKNLIYRKQLCQCIRLLPTAFRRL